MANTLQVVTETWPPFNYHDDNKKVVGKNTDIIHNILKNTSLDYNIALYPWARSYKLAQNKKNHLIYSIFQTPERTKYFYWYCPIAKNIDLYFIKLNNSVATFDTLTEAKNYRIGVIRADAPNAYLSSQGFIEGKNLFLTANENSNIQQLLNGSVDYIVQSQAVIKFRLAQMNKPLSLVSFIQPLLTKKAPLCMALNINSDKKIVEQVDTAFQQWLTTETKSSPEH